MLLPIEIHLYLDCSTPLMKSLEIPVLSINMHVTDRFLLLFCPLQSILLLLSMTSK